MTQGMRVVGSMQQESLWKINEKEKLPVQIAYSPLFFSFFCCFFSQLGIKKKKYMPYNHQHKYFFISEYLHSPAFPWEVLKGLGDSTFDLENLSRTKVPEAKNTIKSHNNNNQIFGRVEDLTHPIPDLPHPPQRLWVMRSYHIFQ